MASPAGPYNSTDPVNLASGHAIDVSLTYFNGTLSLTLGRRHRRHLLHHQPRPRYPRQRGRQHRLCRVHRRRWRCPLDAIGQLFNCLSLVGLAIAAGGRPGGHPQLARRAGGYVLQQSAAVSPTSWTNVAASPVTAGQINQVTLPASASRGFYRLSNTP